MVEVLGIVAMFLPFFVIMWTANLAQLRRERQEPYEGFAIFSYLIVVLLYGAGLIVGLGIQALAFVVAQQPSLLQDLQLGAAAGNLDFPVDSLGLLGLGVWLPSLVGILLLLPPVRRIVSRLIPIDAGHPVHAVSLSLSMLIFINLIFTLGIGLGNLADLLAADEAASQNFSIASLWMQQVMMALLAMVGVGWLSRRNVGEMLTRLKLVLPSWRQVFIGIGLGLAMVPVVMGVEYAGSLLGISADPDVEDLTEQLLGPLIRTPLGILTLGLSAALGEETLFRGALLPRFGLVFTSILFALVHSNYGITISTFIVFALGLLLGWVRYRHNTSTAMLLHATYNMTLGLIAYLGLNFLDV